MAAPFYNPTPAPHSPHQRLVPRKRYTRSRRKGAGWTGLRVLRIDFSGGEGESCERGSPLARRNRDDRARLSRGSLHLQHPPPRQEAQSKQVSEAGHRGTIVRSRGSYLGLRACPGGGPSGTGSARRERRRGQQPGGWRRPKPSASGSPAAESAREAAPRLAGRTRPHGSAGPPARPPLPPPAKQPAPGGSRG